MNRLNSRLLPAKFSILSWIGLLFQIYIAYKHEVLQRCIWDIVEMKRQAECHLVLTTLRSNICLVVEKDCCHKIFNQFIKNQAGGRSGPVFIYSLKDKKIDITDRYLGTDIPYYILSPYIKPNHEYTCYYICNIMSDYMNKTLASFYYGCLNKLVNTNLMRFDLEEVHYSKIKYQKMELYRYEMEELGKIQFTKYFQNNSFMNQVNDILEALCKIKKYSISKSGWSTKAVAMLMRMLQTNDILLGKVSLLEYPEIVPLLFPFRFIVDTNGMYWSEANLVNIGVDLRGVEESDLVCLFNIERVRECCADGGVYISSKLYL